MTESTSVPDLQLAVLDLARTMLSRDFSGPMPETVRGITIPANQVTGEADATDLLVAATTLVVNLVRELADERGLDASKILDALWLQVRVDNVGRGEQPDSI